jgi:ABC-2 type transport system permease protein
VNDTGAESAPRAPSTWRVIALIGALSVRRFANRFGAVLGKRRKPGERGATARKPTTGRLLLAGFGVIFALQAVMGATRMLHNVALEAEQRGSTQIVLDAASWWRLQNGPPELSEQHFHELVEPHDLRMEDDEQRAQRKQLLWSVYRERGRDGFRESQLPLFALWPSTELWYAGDDPLVLLRPLALVAFLLGAAQVLQHVAGSDDDLARVSANLEWLFTFPVRARSLFLARACSALFTGPLVWALIFPLYVVVYWCAGYGAVGIALAAAAAAYQALMAGGLRVLLETSLRRYFSLLWVSRIQASLLTLSVLAMVGGIGVAYTQRVGWVFDWTHDLPVALFLLPPCLPLWLVVPGVGPGWVALGALLSAALWLGACVWIAERMVSAGLSSGGGPQLGRRGEPAAAAGLGRRLWAGVSYKELCALLRDRRLRAQAFLAPALAFGVQFWINPGLLEGIASSPRHIATTAFGVGSFALATGACSTLATEGASLWMLYTLPRPLESLLFDKLRVWLGVAYLFVALAVGAAWWKAPEQVWPSLPYVALAVVGVFLYAVIALGIGSLGTDPLETEPRRRVRVGALYLFMTLSALFAYAIYAPSLWTKFVQLVLSALLAFALWQKLRDHLPYLLDPTEAPPPQIGVADGVIAALAFFVLQGVFAFMFMDRDSEQGSTLLSAFVAAGITVTLAALFALYRSGVPRVLAAVGLVGPEGRRRSRVLELGLGLGAGLLAGALALGYGQLLHQVSWLNDWAERQSTVLPDLGEGGVPLWFVALGVLAAPLFEEFIFRGILYRGLRRSLRAHRAVLASALVFALVHPVVAALPVFVMAVLAAAAYERTGWLVTPIAAHMTYNAIVIGSALLF